MKKLIAVILAVALVLSLVACTGVSHASAADEREVRFQRVDTCYLGGTIFDADICVDMHTGVLYLWSWNSKYTFMTVLVNADGTPMIWEGWEK